LAIAKDYGKNVLDLHPTDSDDRWLAAHGANRDDWLLNEVIEALEDFTRS
jgi:hypothetical protein